MTFRVYEIIKHHVGWCPQGSVRKILCEPDEPCRNVPVPAPTQAAPLPMAPVTSPPAYQENIILILLLLAGLFCIVDFRMLALASLFSALLVYYDAGTLHAGEKFEKESILGDVATWRPLTWAIFVFIIPLIFLAIYTFSRKEIFDANN